MKTPGGPWETVFAAQQPDVDIRVEFNEESLLLVSVTEKKDGKNTGVVLDLFRAFVSETNPQTLIEKLPFPCIEFGLHTDGSTTYWIVLVDSGTVFSEPDEGKISRLFSEQKKKLESIEEQLKPSVLALDHKFEWLSHAPMDVRSAFFGSLLVPPMIVSRTKTGPAQQAPVAVSGTIMRFGEMKVGKTKDGALVREPLVLLKKTIIVGGTPKDRSRVLRVLIESVLLSGSAAVIVDSQNSFSGLREPNPNAAEVAESGFELTPIGFPTEEFEVPNKLWVNFSNLDIESMLELYRVGKTPAAKVIKMVFDLGVAANWRQLVDTIKIQSPAADVTRFHLNKAMRLAALIDNSYPGSFNGPNNMSNIARSLETGLGRAAIVHTDKMDNRLRLLVLHGLVRELRHFFEQSPNRQPLSCMLFLPQASEFFPFRETARISRVIEEDLNAMVNFGVGVTVVAEKGMDLHETIPRQMDSEFSIVSGKDVGLRIEKRKPYRVIIRNPLSRLSE
ncbi:MAG: hypothetical protein J4215_02660 [Candidatus Diapherotrites archaeon]|uniref:Uncharacterized protein n=1 Tax=Candidatus Iainarchaeum sp. TaxID=3101447 RepID=A0A8T4L6G6_9ARCH|nr:hypothetical protein [Candidatus Diapherotrites archaeon]